MKNKKRSKIKLQKRKMQTLIKLNYVTQKIFIAEVI